MSMANASEQRMLACNLGRRVALVIRRRDELADIRPAPDLIVGRRAAKHCIHSVLWVGGKAVADMVAAVIPTEAVGKQGPAFADILLDGAPPTHRLANLGELVDALGPSSPLTGRVLAGVLGRIAPLTSLYAEPGFGSDLAALVARHAPQGISVSLYGVVGQDLLLLDAGPVSAIPVDAVAVFVGSGSSSARVAAAATAEGRPASAGRFAALRLHLSDPAPAHLALVVGDEVRIASLRGSRSPDAEAFAAAHCGPRPALVALAAASAPEDTRLAMAIRRAPLAAAPARSSAHQSAVQLDLAAPTPAGLFLAGSIQDRGNHLVRAEVIEPRLREGRLDAVWRMRSDRPDGEGGDREVRRFAAFLPGPAGSLPQTQVAVTFASGEVRAAVPPAAPSEPAALRRAIIETASDLFLTEDVFEACYRLPVASLTAEIAGRQRIARIVRFGPGRIPKVSVIVPIYGTLAFLRSQLLAFAADRFVREQAELVYVLDDPGLEGDLEHMLRGLQALLGLQVVLVVLAGNAGYALANNFGVSVAAGRELALLNSDVVPIGPGWLETLISARRRTRAGVVGPRLAYPDGTLQHAGMFFRRHPRCAWQNMHYFKGFGRSFAPALRERRVPAVTGAAMVLTRADFDAVGGFSSCYVIGDYEDSDLCLKLADRGRPSWYVPAALLLHAERQSVGLHPGHSDNAVSAFNRALHGALWGSAIAGLMSRFPDGTEMAA